jgi:hypothetical protein
VHREARPAGRHLPQRGVHPVQGAAALVALVRGGQVGLGPARHLRRQRLHGLGQAHEAQGARIRVPTLLPRPWVGGRGRGCGG